MKRKNFPSELNIATDDLFKESLITRMSSFLREHIFLIYSFSAVIATLIVSIILKLFVLPMDIRFRQLVPFFTYSYEGKASKAVIYEDFQGYDTYMCNELQFSDKIISSEITLRFSRGFTHFNFSITQNQHVNITFTSPVNQSNLRELFVISQDGQFIGDTNNLFCGREICNFNITSVLNEKHEVVLNVSQYDIVTDKCEELYAYESELGEYYQIKGQNRYVIMKMAFEESLWGMEKGNGFVVYREIENDLGINIVSLCICFFSIVTVFGGVIHTVVRTLSDN